MSNKAIVIWCGGYHPGRRLAESLGYDLIIGTKHLREKGLRMRPRDVVFNFGHGDLTEELANCGRLVNPGYAIGNAVDKRRSFALFDVAGIQTPEWTTDQRTARNWLGQGKTVFCRMRATGLGGLDIRVVAPGQGRPLPAAPLYTVWLGEDATEFRAHVFDGQVLVRQQKKRMGSEKLRTRGIREPDRYVRVHNKGWVFAEHNITWPRGGDTTCKHAVAALDLDFGTVDFIYRDDLDQPHAFGDDGAFVLEVNTAPGMENHNTFERYKQALRRAHA